MKEIEIVKEKLNIASPIPLYYQIEEMIREYIQTGIFLPGMQMPSENVMYSLLNVSRNTIRKVYEDLTIEGLLEKKQGKGTFVGIPKISHKFVTVVSFTQELIARGIVPSSRVLAIRTKGADKEVAEKLQIQEGSSVIYIERLRYGNGKLLGYNLSRIPEYLCPNIENIEIKDESLYTLIEKRYGHTIVKADRSLETIPADSFIASQIHVQEGFPVLKIVGVAYNENRSPFDYCLEYYID